MNPESPLLLELTSDITPQATQRCWWDWIGPGELKTPTGTTYAVLERGRLEAEQVTFPSGTRWAYLRFAVAVTAYWKSIGSTFAIVRFPQVPDIRLNGPFINCGRSRVNMNAEVTPGTFDVIRGSAPGMSISGPATWSQCSVPLEKESVALPLGDKGGLYKVFTRGDDGARHQQCLIIDYEKSLPEAFVQVFPTAPEAETYDECRKWCRRHCREFAVMD